MEFLISNWILIIIAIAALSVCGYIVYTFMKKSTIEQIEKIKEWLLYAVTEAEKELGSGTGEIKLRYVYDKFLIKFPYLTKIISFELFSNLVDDVLDKFREMLDSNKNLQNYIK